MLAPGWDFISPSPSLVVENTKSIVPKIELLCAELEEYLGVRYFGQWFCEARAEGVADYVPLP